MFLINILVSICNHRLILQALRFRELLERLFDQGPRFGGRAVQVSVQHRIVVVTICAAVAVDLERAQVRNKLREVPRALAFDPARDR